MEAARYSVDELRKAREELHRELDKGIRDMERGDVILHDEMMQQLYAEFGLSYV